MIIFLILPLIFLVTHKQEYQISEERVIVSSLEWQN